MDGPKPSNNGWKHVACFMSEGYPGFCKYSDVWEQDGIYCVIRDADGYESRISEALERYRRMEGPPEISYVLRIWAGWTGSSVEEAIENAISKIVAERMGV